MTTTTIVTPDPTRPVTVQASAKSPLRTAALVCALTVSTVFAPLAALAEPTDILFVGNSFTYTRPPVLQYNTENVVDLTDDENAAMNPALPQPWGGVPGIFEVLTAQAGLDYNVYLSLRGGATLRGHYLNTNPNDQDLPGNIASQTWDVVVLQGNSTEALATPGGDPLRFSTYVDKLEQYIHDGSAESYRESELFPDGNNILRTIPANPNASPDTLVYLYETWARPDLTYLESGPYFGEPLETMASELHYAYYDAAASNGFIEAVAPVGDAFMLAVQQGVAVRDPYNPDKKGVDLWWEEDQFHSSKYGSYLSALVMFGTITGIDPASFGANEKAASDLDIKSVDAIRLQQVASEQLIAAGFALTRMSCLHAHPNARSDSRNTQTCGRSGR